jgi:hypothetical protein
LEGLVKCGNKLTAIPRVLDILESFHCFLFLLQFGNQKSDLIKVFGEFLGKLFFYGFDVLPGVDNHFSENRRLCEYVDVFFEDEVFNLELKVVQDI